MEPTLFSDPSPKPTLIYTITQLQEHDMENIIIGLHLLIDELSKHSIQRMQCEELHHTLKGQLKVHQKDARRK